MYIDFWSAGLQIIPNKKFSPGRRKEEFSDLQTDWLCASNGTKKPLVTFFSGFTFNSTTLYSIVISTSHITAIWPHRRDNRLWIYGFSTTASLQTNRVCVCDHEMVIRTFYQVACGSIHSLVAMLKLQEDKGIRLWRLIRCTFSVVRIIYDHPHILLEEFWKALWRRYLIPVLPNKDHLYWKCLDLY